MDQEDWAKRTAAAIGERVAYYRDQRKLSAQQLAELCSGLGMPSISRIVITKLENGRREAVSTAELQVLAKALDIPPVLLLFPLGHAPDVEALPGIKADPYAAIQWFTGNGSDPANPEADRPDSEVALWNEHLDYDRSIQGWYRMVEQERSWSRATQDQAVVGAHQAMIDQWQEQIDPVAKALRRIRATMRERGLILPSLSPPAAAAIGPEPDEDKPDGPR